MEEEEPPANALSEKLQKDLAHIGVLDVVKISMKIFENHAKTLVTPASQILVMLSTVIISAWALILLYYLDHAFPLPSAIPFQTIMPRIHEAKAPIVGLLLIMGNFGLISVALSVWQYDFTCVVGQIYAAGSMRRVPEFPYKELLITEILTSLILLSAFLVFILSIKFLAMSVFQSWSWVALPIPLFIVVASAAGLVFSVLISQIATAVCLMANCCEEESFGRDAVKKAAIILRGRWRVGLGLAAVYAGTLLLMGSNLLRPGFAAGLGTRLLFSSFQLFLFSVWRQLAYLCWIVFYISCRAFHQDYIDVCALHPEKERMGIESYDSVF